jgi:tripartite-type tricarboxylate transporter receptor subunit TctC
MMAGVDLLHVPYRGAPPALTDLLSGQVEVMFDNLPSSIEHIRAGRLRPLAVTTTAPSELLPRVPTLSDFIPGYEASAVPGIGVPKNTPTEIVNKLNREVNSGLSDPGIRARLAGLGVTPISGSPADFARLIVDETDKWAKVVKFAGIKVE